ncbi:SDR family NAD(P)-dependent oxidoreductase [Paraburkholderia caballeronis]|uniref:SDR family NAD(P)-dependent oxidoreductase n=1 Tax=Paraburkholderia caballeronis TaxID=416943 RepID=UPI001066765D|nr:SDR family oxidoreductase [Paraburkholderia caballeronis]TDV15681.1 NAD(P)-dependent dehydrogenase (short-subunit alcohol dehydrogenase family) [Paraburkholderia caballeronis]TDV17936.1 NAD(P)-dependent dehydrogenase (short-subunit alcohol dehydrogenase family) [Paraburkholderia caballeronis]TDV26450.1 NAD(P)-dependent dehydrogenase (short-subunit alcohol dehydrogenase family) [Paraburkholderia caballeronis]TDV33606.1 NAD(P)-dependent dehydrogenase (short-subunit alcohol dehydrogenase family
MFSLDNKNVLVTGASKGIGAAIATALGAAGANVIAHYGRDREGAEAALADVPAHRKHFVQADLHDLAAAEALWDAAEAACGRIDVYVNNAAIMLWHGGFAASDDVWDAVWQETLAVNVLAPARLIRRAVKHFTAQRGGVLITISSWAAQRGVTNPDTIAYAASKAAVRSMTQTVARAHARDGLLAYVIAPGVVRTQMSESFAQTQGGEASITASLAMGEWVPPDDIGKLVAFLASGAARHLTGATLDVNGASYVR